MVSEVREGKMTGIPRLYIDPMDNILVGSQVIMRYLGMTSPNTLYNWIEVYALPCVKMPNGQWMTSMTAIDQWIFMGAELDAENRVYSRGSNRRAELALAQAQRRMERHRAGKGHTGPIRDDEDLANGDR